MFKQKEKTETGKPTENGVLSKIKDKEVPEFLQTEAEEEVAIEQEEEEEEEEDSCCFCGC